MPAQVAAPGWLKSGTSRSVSSARRVGPENDVAPNSPSEIANANAAAAEAARGRRRANRRCARLAAATPPARGGVAQPVVDRAKRGHDDADHERYGDECLGQRDEDPRREYDYILIDTPPSLGLLTINALTASDHVIVPVQCEYLSLRGLVQLEGTLQMIRENLNPSVEIRGILPTMFDGRTLHAKEAVEMLKENFGNLVFDTKIKKTIRYAEAPVQGSSVLKYDPSGSAAKAYRDLAKEVLNGSTPS